MMQNNATGYTHQINFFKKVNGIGWIEQYFRTTEDAVNLHMKKLENRDDISCLDVVRIK